jgi:hypothetical protein
MLSQIDDDDTATLKSITSTDQKALTKNDTLFYYPVVTWDENDAKNKPKSSSFKRWSSSSNKKKKVSWNIDEKSTSRKRSKSTQDDTTSSASFSVPPFEDMFSGFFSESHYTTPTTTTATTTTNTNDGEDEEEKDCDDTKRRYKKKRRAGSRIWKLVRFRRRKNKKKSEDQASENEETPSSSQESTKSIVEETEIQDDQDDEEIAWAWIPIELFETLTGCVCTPALFFLDGDDNNKKPPVDLKDDDGILAINEGDHINTKDISLGEEPSPTPAPTPTPTPTPTPKQKLIRWSKVRAVLSSTRLIRGLKKRDKMAPISTNDEFIPFDEIPDNENASTNDQRSLFDLDEQSKGSEPLNLFDINNDVAKDDPFTKDNQAFIGKFNTNITSDAQQFNYSTTKNDEFANDELDFFDEFVNNANDEKDFINSQSNKDVTIDDTTWDAQQFISPSSSDFTSRDEQQLIINDPPVSNHNDSHISVANMTSKSSETSRQQKVGRIAAWRSQYNFRSASRHTLYSSQPPIILDQDEEGNMSAEDETLVKKMIQAEEDLKDVISDQYTALNVIFEDVRPQYGASVRHFGPRKGQKVQIVSEMVTVEDDDEDEDMCNAAVKNVITMEANTKADVINEGDDKPEEIIDRSPKNKKKKKKKMSNTNRKKKEPIAIKEIEFPADFEDDCQSSIGLMDYRDLFYYTALKEKLADLASVKVEGDEKEVVRKIAGTEGGKENVQDDNNASANTGSRNIKIDIVNSQQSMKDDVQSSSLALPSPVSPIVTEKESSDGIDEEVETLGLGLSPVLIMASTADDGMTVEDVTTNETDNALNKSIVKNQSRGRSFKNLMLFKGKSGRQGKLEQEDNNSQSSTTDNSSQEASIEKEKEVNLDEYLSTASTVHVSDRRNLLTSWSSKSSFSSRSHVNGDDVTRRPSRYFLKMKKIKQSSLLQDMQELNIDDDEVDDRPIHKISVFEERFESPTAREV